MFKVGVKIGPWPFWTYIWEGEGNSPFFRFPSTSRPMSRPMSRPTPRPTSRPLWESMPIFSIFSEILRILEKFMNRTSEKSAFPYWNLVHSSISLQFSPPAAKKAKTKRFYTPPLGGQKTQAYCLAPQKNLLAGCVSKPFSKQMWRPEMRWCDDGMMWCRDDGMMWWWNHRMMEAIFGPFLGHFSRISKEKH